MSWGQIAPLTGRNITVRKITRLKEASHADTLRKVQTPSELICPSQLHGSKNKQINKTQNSQLHHLLLCLLLIIYESQRCFYRFIKSDWNYDKLFQISSIHFVATSFDSDANFSVHAYKVDKKIPFKQSIIITHAQNRKQMCFLHNQQVIFCAFIILIHNNEQSTKWTSKVHLLLL